MIQKIKEDLKNSGVFADCEIHIFAAQVFFLTFLKKITKYLFFI